MPPTGAPAPSRGPARATGLLGLVVENPAGITDLRLQGRPLPAHGVDTLSGVGTVQVRVLGRGLAGALGLHPGEHWRSLAVDGLVLHDAHCPLLPASSVREAVQLLAAAGPRAVVVGVRPVTDTVKEVVDGAVVGTVDRDALRALASPVVVGAGLLDVLAAALPEAGQLADLTAVLEALEGAGTVVPFEVPSAGRRLTDADDVVLMECLHGLRGRLRER
ncbi:2-C-methyl-D-erythritol 4-phosphate cytidylyltransferase [Klenkia soli]|uniref:2-C-methyl-D-erythritol 4-phosphate cytidylyltransferase n=1 Tax=Klenkia soli TaxID=1052260 RepID=A0A1H0JNT0_9ACTN|nr:2-C-methyl-D-erythritol 4-phosphate cytidylyltransferase [Klenkia soli]SDO45445.1 2-C-methyl-D-erythritol 4-phosphate cytidylyltransferase [Klenkia soli]